ncbi:DUF3152 domain-containing protein [Nocardioides dubius]|uniref:DUF3152 domain-containing protein n=1 Tax=Nocardioides dubius TaxID=317019 RepID=A0ABN1TQA5_9ACTN
MTPPPSRHGRRADRARHRAPRRPLPLRWLGAGLAIAAVATAGFAQRDGGTDDAEPTVTSGKSTTRGSTSAGEEPGNPEPAQAPTSPYSIAPRVRLVPIEVPALGTGSFAVAKRILDDATGSVSGAETMTVRIEVEGGLRHQPDAVAKRVMRTLRDPRGWSGAKGVRFVQVADEPDLRIVLATPRTTDALCAPLLTLGKVSCRNGDVVVLNAWRWEVGTDDYAGELERYRTYLINHEVGHALGESHVDCPGAGQPAPVMQQQTYGLQSCRINVWPDPAR